MQICKLNMLRLYVGMFYANSDHVANLLGLNPLKMQRKSIINSLQCRCIFFCQDDATQCDLTLTLLTKEHLMTTYNATLYIYLLFFLKLLHLHYIEECSSSLASLLYGNGVDKISETPFNNALQDTTTTTTTTTTHYDLNNKHKIELSPFWQHQQKLRCS